MEIRFLNTFLKHIGLYGYRSEVLRRITQLEPGVLERCESLEQLRWLENGYRIKVAETASEGIAIDTPEDLQAANRATTANDIRTTTFFILLTT